ncbi:MAG: DNA repair protein RadC [Nitrospirae bacterium]|nr:DNA repair protein RadC [Nitrospirota bacterium]
MKESPNNPPLYAGHRERLRSRFRETGIQGLQDYEALELLLTYALPRKDTKPIAKTLLNRFGSLRGVFDAAPQELMTIDGVGEAVAHYIKLIKGIFDSLLKEQIARRPVFHSPERVIEYLRFSMGGNKDEQFRILLLDNQNRLIKEVLISEGTVDQAHVYPRRILETTLQYKASGLILVHNHPGGKAQPSKADITLTEKIREVSNTLNIRLLDHLIVTTDSYFSFNKEGLL